MVHPGRGPHRLHLSCYATLRVRAVANLRCPACWATATVEEGDRRALRQRSDEVMAEAMAVARRAMPAGEGGGSSARATLDGRTGRVICSPRNGLVEETAFVQLPCSCNVHRRCTLGFV